MLTKLDAEKIIENLIKNIDKKYNDISNNNKNIRIKNNDNEIVENFISLHEVNYSTELITSINEIMDLGNLSNYCISELKIDFDKKNIIDIIEKINKIYKEYLPSRPNPKHIRLDNFIYFKNKDKDEFKFENQIIWEFGLSKNLNFKNNMSSKNKISLDVLRTFALMKYLNIKTSYFTMIKKGTTAENANNYSTYEIDLNNIVIYNVDLEEIINQVKDNLKRIFENNNDNYSFINIILNNKIDIIPLEKKFEDDFLEEDLLIKKQLIKLNFDEDLKLEIIKKYESFDSKELIQSYKFMKSDEFNNTKYSKNFIDSKILPNTIKAVFNALNTFDFEILKELNNLNENSKLKFKNIFDYQGYDVERIADSFLEKQEKISKNDNKDYKEIDFFVIKNEGLESLMKDFPKDKDKTIWHEKIKDEKWFSINFDDFWRMIKDGKIVNLDNHIDEVDNKIKEGFIRKISYFSFHLNSIFEQNRKNDNSSTNVVNKRKDIILSLIYYFCHHNDIKFVCDNFCQKCKNSSEEKVLEHDWEKTISGLSEKIYKNLSIEKINQKIYEISQKTFILFSFYEKFLKGNDEKIWKKFSENINKTLKGLREILDIEKKDFSNKNFKNEFEKNEPYLIEEKINLIDFTINYIYNNLSKKLE